MNVSGGTTDVTTYFSLRLSATGAEATGLDVTTMDLQYVRTGAAPSAKVDATALAATDSAHSDNKAIEIDATDAPGLYRVDWPDAAFAAGVREVVLSVKCSTCFTEHLRVAIDAPVDVQKWLATTVSTPTVAGVPNVNTKTWNDLPTVALPLIPTTAGRTLDVTTGGEAGIDLDNTSGTLDAAQFGNDCITADKIAAGAIDAATFAAGAIDAAAIAADAIGSSELAASAASEIAAAVMASTGDTGVTLSKALEMLAAFVAGKVSVSSAGGVSTYTYKMRDGTTTSFTSLCSETDGTRATTGALS